MSLAASFELELAYALVGRVSLQWLPQVDELLSLLPDEGLPERSRERSHGQTIWRNVGPRHSLRVKSRGGLDTLGDAELVFSAEISALAELASEFDGVLVGGGMHPWMQPAQAEGWPHGTALQDKAMHVRYGKDRHGFANQQPLTLSLPFANGTHFARLFAALRFAMPLLPALSAASPFFEGQAGPAQQCRVAARRDYFASDLDLDSGLVPPSASCLEEYSQALGAGELHAQGLIADPKSGLIHLHTLDMQECLSGNLAVCSAVRALVLLLEQEEHIGLAALADWPRARLAELVELTLVSSDEAVLRDDGFTAVFGFPEKGACRAGELWQFLAEERLAGTEVASFVAEGPLARRMVCSLPVRWGDEDLYDLYRKLGDCHRDNEVFRP